MLPTPEAAAEVVLEMADAAPLVAFVSHDFWAGGLEEMDVCLV
jgi:hypothetical protein